MESRETHIGKNIIETLTSGMYEDSRFIFREYIQNSVDQIDVAVEHKVLKNRSEGVVDVRIDNNQRVICIEDNATGISADSTLRFLGDVANSDKDPKYRRGFRGIGRLGGLGYCDKLIFETSYKGENIKSTVTFDAKLLKRIIDDRSDDTDAAAVISIITSVTHDEESIDSHYFKVTLENVHSDTLLDSWNIMQYLKMVAPIPFHNAFKFRDEIKLYFKKNNFLLDEYNILLNGETLYKGYANIILDKDKQSNVIGVDFFKINDLEGNLLAIGWFGIRDYVNVVMSPNVNERGIRLRQGNIQIGSDVTLNSFFKDRQRTNSRFIGELHTASSLIPNARRDYFNEDNATTQTFEKELKAFLLDKNWEAKLAQKTSQIHSGLRNIQRFREALAKFEEVKNTIDNEVKRQILIEKITDAKDKAFAAVRKIEQIKNLTEDNKNLRRLYDFLLEDVDLSFDNDIEDKLKLDGYDPPTFNRLNDAETNLVREILNIIYENISLEDSDALKKKLIRKYNS